MPLRGRPGASPFERLRTHFEATEVTCPECGYEDAAGKWRVETDGRRLRYRHVCPSCDTQRVRSYAVER